MVPLLVALNVMGPAGTLASERAMLHSDKVALTVAGAGRRAGRAAAMAAAPLRTMADMATLMARSSVKEDGNDRAGESDGLRGIPAGIKRAAGGSFCRAALAARHTSDPGRGREHAGWERLRDGAERLPPGSDSAPPAHHHRERAVLSTRALLDPYGIEAGLDRLDPGGQIRGGQ